MKFNNTNNSYNNFEVGQYKYDSLDNSDNGYSDFSKEEESDKRRKFDKDKSIVLPSLLALRLVELNQNRANKAKLYEA